jgi:glycosyltransferase involved in cell wall biosynthesis
MKLSVVLATLNEEDNIGPCLESVKDIADEIIVFDESSTDKTREIARDHGAKVYKTKHQANFHITKQKAIDKAQGGWILQLDADERVTLELANEIKSVIRQTNKQLKDRILSRSRENGKQLTKKQKLFLRHQRLIEQREGHLASGSESLKARRGRSIGEVVAFFIPRMNFFLGKPLIHGGVYPDGVIRLFKNGKARLPGRSVHELMEIDGEVGWLFNDLEHHESPTLKRYLNRNLRYIELVVDQMKEDKLEKNLFNTLNYIFIKPTFTFVSLFIRHKAILDGYRGFIWSFFSSLRFSRAYLKYCQKY